MAIARQTTAVRFSLRGLMIAIVVVAAYCAAVAPTYRAWSDSERQAFLLTWGGAFIGWLGIIVLISAERVIAERRAGPVRLSLNVPLDPAFWRRFSILTAVLIALIPFQAHTTVTNARMQADFAAMGQRLNGSLSPWFAILTGGVAGCLALVLWWRDDPVQFCDRGIQFGGNFTRWPAVDYEWQTSDPHELVLKLGKQRRRISVPEEVRAEVNEMLRRRYASLASEDEIEDSETTR